MPIDLSQEGENRDVRATRLRGGPSQRASLANARLPFGMGDGMRLLGAQAQSVSAQLVVEGTDPGAGVTAVPLAFGGGMELGEGQPGVPVGMPVVMRWVATSWMSDNEPSGPWTLELWVRRDGGSFNLAATFDANTTEP